MEQCPDDRRASKASGTSAEDITKTEEDTCQSKDLEVQDPAEDVLHEMEGVPPRIERGSYWDGRNRYDLLREIEDEEDHNSSGSLEDHTPSHLPTYAHHTTPRIPRLPPTTSSPTFKPPPKSPLNLHPQPKVHTADHVTIISDSHALSTPNLPPSQPPYTRPHSSHTTAETARRRLSFNRRSHLYVPRTWAPSPGRERTDTSHYRTSWAEWEATQRLGEYAEAGTDRGEAAVSSADDDVGRLGARRQGGCDASLRAAAGVGPCAPCAGELFAARGAGG